MGVVLTLAAVALALRTVLLFARPLWSDELFTVWATRLPFPEMLDALSRDSGPPGFYVLERPFVRLAEALGVDALVRLLPFLAAILLLAAARALPAGTARRVGMVLFAGHALLGLYAVEARSYALLGLLCLLLFRLAREGEESAGRLAATIALAAAALYTHYLAIPVVAALLALALSRRRFRTTLALSAGAVLFAPWLPVLLAQPAAAIAWVREPAGSSALGFLSALGGVGRIPLPFGPPLPPLLPACGAAVGAAVLLALIPAARRDRVVADAALVSGAVLGAAILLSLLRPFAFPGRTELAVLPIWIWGVSHASRESRVVERAGIFAASLGALAVGLLALSPHPPSAAARAAGALERLAKPGDTLFAGPGHYLPFRVAADRGAPGPRLKAFPEEVERHPGWWSAAAPSDFDYSAVAAACEARSGEVFLLLPPAFVTPRLREILTARGSVRELPLPPEAVLLHFTPRS